MDTSKIEGGMGSDSQLGSFVQDLWYKSIHAIPHAQSLNGSMCFNFAGIMFNVSTGEPLQLPSKERNCGLPFTLPLGSILPEGAPKFSGIYIKQSDTTTVQECWPRRNDLPEGFQVAIACCGHNKCSFKFVVKFVLLEKVFKGVSPDDMTNTGFLNGAFWTTAKYDSMVQSIVKNVWCHWYRYGDDVCVPHRTYGELGLGLGDMPKCALLFNRHLDKALETERNKKQAASVPGDKSSK